MEERQLARTREVASRFVSQGGVVLNPRGKIEVTEIIDYNCSFCRSSFDKIKHELDGAWKDVRVTVIPLPILGKDTESAVVLTRIINEKGGDVQEAVKAFLASGRVTTESTEKISHKMGISNQILESNIKKSRIAAGLQSDLKTADALSIKATPSFIISGKVLTGFDEGKMSEAIAEVRAATN